VVDEKKIEEEVSLDKKNFKTNDKWKQRFFLEKSK
jgi:hypothetical protein